LNDKYVKIKPFRCKYRTCCSNQRTYLFCFCASISSFAVLINTSKMWQTGAALEWF